MISKQIFIDEKIIPVIREASFEAGLKNSIVAIEAGLNVIEVTFTTPDAHKIVEELIKKYPNQTIGVGTILTVKQANQAIEAGAKFIVSPAFSKQVSEICKEKDILYVPGTITPTEVITAFQAGWEFLKIFPGSLVGQGYIKSVKAVVPTAEFMVTGGVSLENITEWLATPAKAVGLGSALFQGTEEEIKARVAALKDKVNA